MSEQRIARLQQQNERLKQELELPRIAASEACKEIINYCKQNQSKDPLAFPGSKDSKANNPYDTHKKKCELI